ncbi:FecR domain-containing protein [Caulobacter sp. BK020]|uniref:FecR family protein n=1 Tax=Caulobacter sp. BK020 TaxID=2512117 RepID=UPI00104C0B90|nr:FecR domain-containing protein [Caulobacter sp. BK020]TCS04310.1 FecR family protein [Caulobacter sp. BK020]
MTQSVTTDPIQQAASDWFARLQGDAGLEDWTAFQAWLEADPAHAAAYDAVEAMWVELEDLPAEQITAPAPAETVVAFAPRPKPSAKPPARRWVWIGLATAAAAAAVVVAILPQLTRPTFTDYSTKRGETREVALADGSRLTLGGATTLRVRLTRAERDVTLVDGEASFDVAHLENRPFVVAAGDREVRVLGTEFNILSHDDRLAITVRRGLVQVSGGPDGAVRLAKGQQLIHTRGSATSLVRATDPDAAFAWKTGKLVYRETPLAEVVADLNRYVATPLRVDPSAASVKVTGVLVVDEEAAMIRRLELFAPVVGQHSGGEILLKARPTQL